MTPERDIASQLGELARRGAETDVNDPAHERGRARFVESVAEARRLGGGASPSSALSGRGRALTLRGRVPTRRGRLLALLAAAAVVILGIAIWARTGATVDYAVEGAPIASGGYVQTAPLAAASVRFTDGSLVTLAPSSAGRVTERRARGARFSLERGHAVVHVAKREGGADYLFDAGPYSVKVTGTAFDLGWEPSSQTMRLVLTEGSVVVTGPEAESGVTMHAGQTIEGSPWAGLHLSSGALASGAGASSPRGDASATPSITTALGGTTSSASASSASASNASASSAEAPPSGSSGEPGSLGAPASDGRGATKGADRSAQERSWAERVAAGDFAGVLADAEARGVDGVLAGAPLGDLMALADAARYGGKGAIARSALKSVRSRFAGTKSASTAAFLLGRMAEDGGNLDGALALYETAMAEGSTFSAEALGHRMLIVKRSRGDAAARPLAEQYLKSFPKGPYADAARSIAGL